MKKVDLTKVEDLKQFIDYKADGVELEIIQADEIPNDGVRFMVEDSDGKITFQRFYFNERSIPFFKKFVTDIGLDITTIKNPLQIIGTRFKADIFLVGEEYNKMSKITNIRAI